MASVQDYEVIIRYIVDVLSQNGLHDGEAQSKAETAMESLQFLTHESPVLGAELALEVRKRLKEHERLFPMVGWAMMVQGWLETDSELIENALVEELSCAGSTIFLEQLKKYEEVVLKKAYERRPNLEKRLQKKLKRFIERCPPEKGSLHYTVAHACIRTMTVDEVRAMLLK